MVQAELEPILNQHEFFRLTGPAYVENNDGMIALYYENTTSNKQITLDIMKFPESGSNPPSFFYSIRLDIAGINLKESLHPNIRQETDDVHQWYGWKGYSQDDVLGILKEMAAGLHSQLEW